MNDSAPLHRDQAPPPGVLAALLDDVMGLPTDAGGCEGHPAINTVRQHGFEPIARSNHGGVAEIWRGFHQNTGREMAIKVGLRDEVTGEVDPATARVLEQEADTLGRLSVPGVVTLIGRGGRGVRCFLAVPWIEGPTIDAYVGQHSDPESVTEAVGQLIDAVRGMHRDGLAHGDLKPANILVGEGNQVRLIDLGFSRPLDRVGGVDLGLAVRGGTPAYQPTDERPDLNAGQRDLFALSLVIEELIEGHRSIQESLQDRLQRWRSDDIPTDTADQLEALSDELWSERRTSKRMLGVSAAVLVFAVAGLTWWLANLAAPAQGDPRFQTLILPTASRWAGVVTDLDDGRLDAARLTLGRVDAGRRDWAWRHLWTATGEQPAYHFFPFSIEPVSHALPERRDLAVAGTWDGRVVAMDGQGEVWSWRDQAGFAVSTMAWSPDARRVLVALRSGELVELDADGGTVLRKSSVDIQEIGSLNYAAADLVRLTSRGGEIAEFDLKRGAFVSRNQHRHVVLAQGSRRHWLAVDGKGEGAFRLRVFGAAGGVLWTCDLDSGEMPLSFDLHAATGRIAIGLTGGAMILSNVGEAAVTRLDATADTFVSAVAFDGSGDLVLAAGHDAHLVSFGDHTREITFELNNDDIVISADWSAADEAFSVQTTKGNFRWRANPAPQLASR